MSRTVGLFEETATAAEELVAHLRRGIVADGLVTQQLCGGSTTGQSDRALDVQAQEATAIRRAWREPEPSGVQPQWEADEVQGPPKRNIPQLVQDYLGKNKPSL